MQLQLGDTTRRITPSRPSRLKRAALATFRRSPGQLLILAGLVGWIPMRGKAADSYSTIVSNHLALETGARDSKYAQEGKGEDPQTSILKRAVTFEAEMLPQSRLVAPPPPPGYSGMVLAVVLPIAGFSALGIIAYLTRRWLDSLAVARRRTDRRLAALVAEDPAVATFFTQLRDSLTVATHAGPADPNKVITESGEREPDAASDPLQEFFASAPSRLASLRKVFSDFSRADEEAARSKVLAELLDQVKGLKESSRPRELRPVWLMAFALEGLLQQLSKNPGEVTPSALGTVAGAVDLLGSLCVRGLNPTLATEPPVRLLAVDDDPVSRLAVSFALKRAFNPPDLAPDGKAALDLIAQQAYDVIFLDVDMPGMDGFELCTKIHQTKNHQTTPIVFVTRFGDFECRAKSALSGGEDLIAKPFLAFEITVKALTLALRGRLQGNPARSSTLKQDATPSTALAASDLNALPLPVTIRSVKGSSERVAERNGEEHQVAGASDRNSSTNSESSSVLQDCGSDPVSGLHLGASPNTLVKAAWEPIGVIRKQFQAVGNTLRSVDFQKRIRKLREGVQWLSSKAKGICLRQISRFSCVLVGLGKKLRKRKNPSDLSSTKTASKSPNHVRLRASSQQRTPPTAAATSRRQTGFWPVTNQTAASLAKKVAETEGRHNHVPAARKESPSKNGESSAQHRDHRAKGSSKPRRQNSTEINIKYASARIGELRRELPHLEEEVKAAEIQRRLGQLYCGVHALSLDVEGMDLPHVSKIWSALEGLIKKSLGNTKLLTPATLNALSAALELLEDLYSQDGVDLGPANQPVRILVVDDDPVARRAISAAIQLAFGKPDHADCGESALAQARKKSYDLVFMDVLMPGMDGFTACKSIRETPLNQCTPIVLVTGSDNQEARVNGHASGSCGFIPKPVLPSQMTLVTLTFVLRHRLEQRTKQSPTPKRAASLEKVH